MTGNRSLDDFLGTDDEAEEETATDDGADAEVIDDDTDRTGATDQPTVAPSETDAPAADEVAFPNDTGDDTAADGVTDAPTDPVDEPRTTLRWSPDGDDCPACGSWVNRQWRDGDRFVCADCKEW